MKIRYKLFIASLVPVLLLVLQVVSVNYFIRQFQAQVNYIQSAQELLEAKFQATDKVDELRELIKRLPVNYSAPEESSTDIRAMWNGLDTTLNQIKSSPVQNSLESPLVLSLEIAAERVSKEMQKSQLLADRSDVDFDTLVEQAITSDAALTNLEQSLDAASVRLRQQLQASVSDAEKIQHRPTVAGTSIGLFAVFISVFIIWLYVDRRISRRLTELSQKTLAVADGKLDILLPKDDNRDEIGDLSRALQVFRDTAVTVADANLRERQQERKQRLYWLENLAAFLRHELKNKQLGAEQSIQLLLEKDNANPLVLRYSERALQSLKSIRELINSAVQATDIESALLSEQFQTLAVSSMLVPYVQAVRNQMNADVTFIDESVEPVHVHADLNRLEQMLDKLIQNAVDFHASGSTIVVRLHRAETVWVSISVENEGPGLPDNTDALFELSVTSRPADDRQPNNVGLGLFVAKRIAESHGGSIHAANAESGPVFTVILPIESTG